MSVSLQSPSHLRSMSQTTLSVRLETVESGVVPFESEIIAIGGLGMSAASIKKASEAAEERRPAPLVV